MNRSLDSVLWDRGRANLGKGRPMRIFAKPERSESTEDIALSGRLQAISGRGKLEAGVYDGWQPSRPAGFGRRNKTKEQ